MNLREMSTPQIKERSAKSNHGRQPADQKWNHHHGIFFFGDQLLFFPFIAIILTESFRYRYFNGQKNWSLFF